MSLSLDRASVVFLLKPKSAITVRITDKLITHASSRIDGNSHLRAFLGPRAGAGEIVTRPVSALKLRRGRSIRAVIKRDIKLFFEVLVPVAFIIKQSVSPEGQGHHLKARNTGRNAQIIGERTDGKPITIRRFDSRHDAIIRAIRTTSNKIFPAFPEEASRDVPVMNDTVHGMHHRRDHRSTAQKESRRMLEGITGENLGQTYGEKLTHLGRKKPVMRKRELAAFSHIASRFE